MRVSCTICSVKFENGSTISSASCGHVFHVQCAKVMLRTLHTCPECKTHLSANDISNISFDAEAHSKVNSEAFENKIKEIKTDSNVQKWEEEESMKGNASNAEHFADSESDSSESEDSDCSYESSLDSNPKVKSVSRRKAKADLIKRRNLLLSDGFERLNNVKLLVSSLEADLDDITQICTQNMNATAHEIFFLPFLQQQYRNYMNNPHKTCSDTCKVDLAKAKLERDKFKEQVINLKKENEALRQENFNYSVHQAGPAPPVQIRSPSKDLGMTALNAGKKCKMSVPNKKVGKTSVKPTSTRTSKHWLRSGCKAADKNSVKRNTAQ